MAIASVGTPSEQFAISRLSLLPPREPDNKPAAALIQQLAVSRETSATKAQSSKSVETGVSVVEPLASPGDVPVRFGTNFGHKIPGGPVQLSPELTALSMTLQETVNVAIPLNGFAGPSGLMQIGTIVNLAA